MCSGTPCAGFAVKSCCCCVCSSVAGCIAPPLWSWYGKPSAGFLLFCTTAAGPIVAVATVCGVEMPLLMFAGLTCCYSCCFCYLVLLSIGAAWLAVERWLVDRAVLPIENSLGGSIHRNYDLLLRHRLHIAGEVKLAIRHCLLANHGIEVQDLKMVLSHPQALAQCENTLTRLGMVREAFVAFHKLNDTGAVASSTAARIYGMNILAEDIQDDSDNVTQFLVLAREPIIPGTNRLFKTNIVFSLEEGPGMLFKALAGFAMRDINLTKLCSFLGNFCCLFLLIESRPLQKQALQTLDNNNNGFPKRFPYLFYVDFEASMADQKAQNAIGHLKV
ncbi:hypothetical protein LOK49_LG15G01549 [Camellia lanceoleosa]|uniref:Uncharacterized protein n=1 Tax=Camellia lanceoleosa TaxID=1840588 RepID=A0ACC0F4R5_9ERIC|nr:hypothetical protein LOK49_LG15G01549 [Camellia lanceoleosa]